MPLKSPEECREEARRVRSLVETAATPTQRQLLLGVAEAYDSVAQAVGELADSPEKARPIARPKFDYWFEVTSVIPPVGDCRFAAGVTIYWFENDRGKEVKHDLGECLGTTKEEAEAEMRSKVFDWMKRQKHAAGNS